MIFFVLVEVHAEVEARQAELPAVKDDVLALEDLEEDPSSCFVALGVQFDFASLSEQLAFKQCVQKSVRVGSPGYPLKEALVQLVFDSFETTWGTRKHCFLMFFWQNQEKP